jgi:TetR/AcrR family transcriptional regulator, lmrAB and yxaGH operons repressor
MDRTEAVQKIVTVFRQWGYEGTTLSLISEATGLGKASLYHHFPKGKQEMAEAVLEYAGQWFAENILAPLHGEGTPAKRITLMNDRLSQFYDCGRSACLLAIFTLGEPESLFQVQVHQMLDAWINSLTVLLVETGIPEQAARQRAEDAVIQVQGALVLTRGLNSTEPFKRVLQQLPVKLLEPMTRSAQF